MFSRGSGFQIYGGNFYHVHSGDVNLHTHQHLMIPDRTLRESVTGALLRSPATLRLEHGSAEGYSRELSGVARNTRQMVGRAPYGAATSLVPFFFSYLQIRPLADTSHQVAPQIMKIPDCHL
jgi:hypothetical protein